MHSLRKLMVLGLNELLSKKLVSLNGEDEQSGFIVGRLAGESSIIQWSSIGSQELSISVWWKFDVAAHPKAQVAGGKPEYFAENGLCTKEANYPKFVGAMVSGWLERRTGKFIQGEDGHGFHHTYMRRGESSVLSSIPTPIPLGFKASGKIFF